MTTTTIPMAEKDSMFLIFKEYLPEEHHGLINTDESGIVFADTQPMFQMYGSCNDLEGDVRKFRSFPGSHSYFDEKLTAQVTSAVDARADYKRKEYIYKHDIFTILQGYAFIFNFKYVKELVPMISYYRRAKEKEIGRPCEMILYQEDEFQKFENNLIQAFNKPFKSTQLKTKKVDEVINKFKAILPKNADDPEYSAIKILLNGYTNNKPVRTSHKFYQNWIDRVALIIKLLDDFIKKHEDWFRPKTRGPAIVRLFRDVNQTYVMVHELLSEMRKAGLNYQKIEKEVEKMPELSVWEKNKVIEKIGDDENNVAFIQTAVSRTRHRAVYIPTIDGAYCIPTADALMEYLHYIISVKSMFQNEENNEEYGPRLRGLVHEAVETLIEFSKGARLISLENCAQWRSGLSKIHETDFRDILEKRKLHVFKISSEGFTASALEAEIRRLGFHNTLPEIFEYHESLLNLIKKDLEKNVDKPTKEPRTCDMHKALEICVVMCLCLKDQTMINFFHGHTACFSFRIPCVKCCEELKTRKAAEQSVTSSEPASTKD